MRAGVLILAALMASVQGARSELALETLPGCPDELVYHLRVEAPKSRDLNFSMVWNYATPDRRCRLDVKATPGMQADELLGGAVSYQLWQADSLLANGTCRSDHALSRDRGVSVVLTYNSAGAFVQIGDNGPRTDLRVDFDASAGQTIGFDAQENVKIIRNDIRTALRTEPRFAPFSDVDELMAYIRASRDPRECLWQYLDRDTDPAVAEPGGRYTLATVADGSGGYLIVYLDGAKYARREWEPLQIKGQLKPTIFRNHFDLEWYDTRRRVVAAECSATITTSGTILELDFPLLKSSMRFSRYDSGL